MRSDVTGWFHRVLGLLLLFVRPVVGEVRLITGDANGQLHDQDSFVLDLSGDGNLVLFTSGPPPSGTTPGIPTAGLYVRNLAAGTLTRVAEPADGDASSIVEATLSDDGRYVAWHSARLNVFWRDTQTGETRRLTPEEGKSRTPKLSADGRYVAFVSTSRQIVADPTLLPASGRAAVFVHDSQAVSMTVASLTHDGRGLATGVGSQAPSLEFDFSADGQYVFFATDSPNAHPDRAQAGSQAYHWTYRRHRQTGLVEIVCRNTAGEVPTGNFTTPRCDGTGTRVILAGAFVGLGGGPTLVPGYSAPFSTDLYVKDLGTGEAWRVSRTTDDGPPDGAFVPGTHAISRDGRVTAFASSGTKFVAEPTDPAAGVDKNAFDVFRAELGPAGEVRRELVTRPFVGTENVTHFSGPFLPGDGRYVAFVSRNHQPLIGTGEVSSIWEHGYAVGNVGNGATTVTAYLDWAQALPESERDYLASPRGDGITNLEKFVYGLDPWSSDRSSLPRPVVLPGTALGLAGDERRYLSVAIPVRRGLPSGVKVVVRAGSMVHAYPETLAPVGAPEAAGSVDLFRFRLPQPIAEADQGFLRIDLTTP